MNNIKTLRLSRRMSREEFAARIGVYADYLIDLETSQRTLTAVWSEAIAKGFGVAQEDFASPVFDGAAYCEEALPPQRQFACPIVIRFALQTLIAKLAGVNRSLELTEDQYADAVISLNAFIADSAEDPNGRENQFNRLLKGLQITVLTIAQSCEIDLQNGFEEILADGLAPLARLIGSSFPVNVSDPEMK